MRFGSVCSGIEAASVAWKPLGWRALWLSEIELFPNAVLAHRYPNTLNTGNMLWLRDFLAMELIETPDILVGGTPCQAFSVAGLRQSLDDERGNLTLTFITIADEIDRQKDLINEPATIIVWENVPGVLNTKDNAFGCFLAGLCGEEESLQPPRQRWQNAGVVFGTKRQVAWRVLDAQFFGVPQRRRRVFVVASARDDFNPAEVLFERQSLSRDIEASEQSQQEITSYAESSFAQYRQSNVAATLEATGGTLSGGSETLVVHGTQDPCVSNKAFSVGRNRGAENCVFIDRQLNHHTNKSTPLTAGDSHIVRRLTPVECERLQGFPDDWTKVPYRNKGAEDCPDSPRYRAIGNSMAVPVMRWIGQRIKEALPNA